MANRSPEPTPWGAFINTGGNPRIPTLGEDMQQVLILQEADRFADHVRRLVEHGHGCRRVAVSYCGLAGQAVRAQLNPNDTRM
jgi:hypothetical protein